MSAPQSVLDALADAETLRRYIMRDSRVLQMRPACLGAVTAAHISAGHTRMAGQCAEAAARSAFLAVPALRGEE